MLWVKKLCACTVALAFALSGCQTTGGSGVRDVTVGPDAGTWSKAAPPVVDEDRPRLDVVIPVFDPGLSTAGESYEEEGVWPEIRRAEANRFAYLLKQEIEKTQAFGSVRVVPEATATGDLYVMGRIIKSNGRDVEIKIDVYDSSKRRWLSQSLDHEVGLEFFKNPRNAGKDPYMPVFERAAARMVEALNKRGDEQLDQIPRIAELRFASAMSEAAFADYLTVNGGVVTLAGFPSEEDPMLARTRALRVRDRLFIDDLQEHYAQFNNKMDSSYRVWQEQSLREIEAQEAAEAESLQNALLGIVSLGLGAVSIVAGAQSDTRGGQTLGMLGGTALGVAGYGFLSESAQNRAEAEVYRETLNELGESVNLEMAPRVVEFDEKTTELTGDIREQFSQWRAFLSEIYAEEATPMTKL